MHMNAETNASNNTVRKEKGVLYGTVASSVIALCRPIYDLIARQRPTPIMFALRARDHCLVKFFDSESHRVDDLGVLSGDVDGFL